MRKLTVVILMGLFVLPAFADREKEVERLALAGKVIEEIMSAEDNRIPNEVFADAECVAVVPSLAKAALGFGGKYGKGVATCRTASGGWSAPAFFKIAGGSFGLQIGGEAVDLVMLIMNKEGMNNLLSSKFKLSGEGSVAAGPVGRQASGQTDWKMRAKVLTYSRSRGLFAGLSLEGATITHDKGDTRDFYGRNIAFKRILSGQVQAPSEAQPFLSAVGTHGGNRPPE
jgi:lipid-binding SYLF domain-containing protein